MGSTSIHANNYKNGKVDRLAEVNDFLNSSNETNTFTVLKSVLKGAIVYAATEIFNKETKQKRVIAEIVATSVNSNDYYNFSYKNFREVEGPFYYDCPSSILKLLSPTDNEYALEWRKKCQENIDKKAAQKKDVNSLNNLPIGSKINMKNFWEDGKPTIILIKIKHSSYKKPIWVDGNITSKFKQKIIEDCGYDIIS